ncbi:MAG TPA: recombinase family protein [Tepidisphaeraceae bacterium]|nr:recombinase family protein [Tepidisphaeraceae bacterium]
MISYLRFSRLEQRKGDSIRRQFELSQKWAAARGLEIDNHFRDEGVSAYRSANATKGALSRLLKLIEDGEVPKGSYLLVESLDRLSRADIPTALRLFLSIVDAGVTIVTLADEREYAPGRLELAELVTSIVIMSRANEESTRKSRINLSNWERKRSDLLTSGKPLTKTLPAWLELVDGRPKAIDAKVKIIKRMFALVLKGYGLGAITRMFNRERVENISGRTDRWERTYIHSILRSRQVLGELTMHRVIEGKRVPVETVKNYYPKVVSEEHWETANAILEKRRSRKYGGPTSKFVNVFNGLLYDENGDSWTVYEKKSRFQREKGKPYRCLVSLGAIIGRQARQVNLRLQVFEAAFFDVMLGRYADSFMVEEHTDSQSELLRSQLATIEKKMSDLQEEALSTGAGSIKAVVGLLTKLEDQRRTLEEQLKASLGKVLVTDTDRLRKLFETYRKLAAGHSSDGERLEMQAVLRQLVERIHLSLDRVGSEIRGTCEIVPVVGESIFFDLAFNPYTNSRKGNPLERARWEVWRDI